MQGGSPASAHAHHVVVALPDLEASDRISDADVDALVGEIGLSGPMTRKLEPFTAAESLTYGNRFEMKARTRDVLRLSITKPGGGAPLTTSFEYDHD